MIAIEALEKLFVELIERGYRCELKFELPKKVATLRCNMKDEDIATLARRILPEEKVKELKLHSSSRVAREF
jgi:hypothetical protein